VKTFAPIIWIYSLNLTVVVPASSGPRRMDVLTRRQFTYRYLLLQ